MGLWYDMMIGSGQNTTHQLNLFSLGTITSDIAVNHIISKL